MRLQSAQEKRSILVRSVFFLLPQPTSPDRCGAPLELALFHLLGLCRLQRLRLAFSLARKAPGLCPLLPCSPASASMPMALVPAPGGSAFSFVYGAVLKKATYSLNLKGKKQTRGQADPRKLGARGLVQDQGRWRAICVPAKSEFPP